MSVPGGGALVPQVNKFEQVSSDGHQSEPTKKQKNRVNLCACVGGGGGRRCVVTGTPVFISAPPPFSKSGWSLCLLLCCPRNPQIHLGTPGDLLTAIVLPNRFDPFTFSSIGEVYAAVCGTQALDPSEILRLGISFKF